MKQNLLKIICVIILIIVSYHFGRNSSDTKTKPQLYIFDSKTFFENKTSGYESIYVAGTLTGDGDSGNNTTAITCNKNKMECSVSYIRGISNTSCQLGRLGSPVSYPIIKWNKYSVTATDEDPNDTWSCYKNTINISLDSQIVEWIEEPINQSKLICKDIKDAKIHKFTIEDSPWMKHLENNLKK